MRALYINKEGDTISNEIVVVKPLGRPWWPQPWLQKSIRYIYSNDSNAFRQYVDPDPYFRERNIQFDKKGKMRIRPKETTGGIFRKEVVYMHPPRTNQYRMLFYAAHPLIYFGQDMDKFYPYQHKLEIPFNHFTQIYNASYLSDSTLFSKNVRVWKFFVESKRDKISLKNEERIYNSTLDALFTREFGFIKMHYTFENGIRILFDLEKVVDL